MLTHIAHVNSLAQRKRITSLSLILILLTFLVFQISNPVFSLTGTNTIGSPYLAMAADSDENGEENENLLSKVGQFVSGIIRYHFGDTAAEVFEVVTLQKSPAEALENIANNALDFLGISDAVTNMVNTTLISFLSDIDGSETINILLGTDSGFMDAAVGNASDSTSGRDGVGTVVLNATKIVASALLLLYTVLEIIKMAERGETGIDMFGIPLLKMTVAFTCILFVNDIASYIEQLGVYFVNHVSNSAFSASEQTVVDLIGNFQYEGDFWKSIQYLLVLCVFMFPISKLLVWAVKIQSYALFFELAIRKAFMPIALCNLISGGQGSASPGLRAIKKYFAVYLKMAIFLIAIAVSNVLIASYSVTFGTGAELNSLINSFATPLCCRTASLAVFQQATKYTDEILGR